MNIPRYAFAVAAVDCVVYAIGGNIGGRIAVGTVEAFDPSANGGVGAWYLLTDMTTPRFGLTAQALNGKIYAIGGKDGSGVLATVEVFDPAASGGAGAWTTLTDLNTARFGLTSQVANGTIYAIGGQDSGYLATVEAFDPAAAAGFGAWTAKADMTTPRPELTAQTVNGIVYAIGGGLCPGLVATEAFNPAGAGSWSPKTDMTTARKALASAAVSGIVYALGGIDSCDTGNVLHTLEAFDPTGNSGAGAWSSKADMPTARQSLSSTQLNGIVYAIGGNNNNGSVFNTVEAYTTAAVAGTGTPRLLFSSTLAARCRWFQKTDTVDFVFDRSMDPATFVNNSGVLSNFYSANGNGGTYTQSFMTTSSPNDTLRFAPNPTWTTSDIAQSDIAFTVKDLQGRPFTLPDTLTFIYDPVSLNPFVYVDGTLGSDVNTGTSADAPFATLGAAHGVGGLFAGAGTAILVTPSTTLVTVLISGYDVTGGFPLDTNQSLCGGFSPDFTERNPATHETVLVDASVIGGSAPPSAPLAAIVANGTANNVVVDGFTIVTAGGGSALGNTDFSTVTASAGFYLTGNAYPIISNNIVKLAGAANTIGVFLDPNNTSLQSILAGNQVMSLPGTGAGTTAYGFYVGGAGPTIAGNIVLGLQGAPNSVTSSSFGIWMDGTSLTLATPLVTGNIIDGGIAFNTTGIRTLNGSPTISDNIAIIGGTSASPCTGTDCSSRNAIGIDIFAAFPTISNNLFIGGGRTVGLYGVSQTLGIRDGSGAFISGNVINGGSGSIDSRGIVASIAASGVYDANTVSGGSGATAVGLTVAGASTNVRVSNNVISGCGRYHGATPESCTGLLIAASTGTLALNNTINGGNATTSSIGIDNDATSTSTFQNNLVFATLNGALGTDPAAICARIGDSTALIGFDNNDLFGCGQHYFDQILSQNVDISLDPITIEGAPQTLAALNNLPDVDPGFVRLGADPGQVDAPLTALDWHLTAGSPDPVRGSGLILSFSDDRDAATRRIDITTTNQGWSLGAYISPTQLPPPVLCQICDRR